MLKKVISGGQTGADQAVLHAANDCGLETGGFAPKGYRTSSGPDLSLKRYGLIEDTSYTYPPRTRLNLAHSDATVGFGDMDSPGMRLTRRYCVELDKPFWDNPDPDELVRLIRLFKVETLNVAGNRESTHPGIYKTVYYTLGIAFRSLRTKTDE